MPMPRRKLNREFKLAAIKRLDAGFRPAASPGSWKSIRASFIVGAAGTAIGPAVTSPVKAGGRG
jgi:hypothetical protein